MGLYTSVITTTIVFKNFKLCVCVFINLNNIIVKYSHVISDRFASIHSTTIHLTCIMTVYVVVSIDCL